MNRPTTKLAAIRKGKKDVRAGRIVSHKKTTRWLRSWGNKRELLPPSCAHSGQGPALEQHQGRGTGEKDKGRDKI
jgi:hypothetical protein